MDEMLKRVLSLIPKKDNGDFKHGAKKAFAIDIGFKSGEIVSDWIAGRSKSYEGYLYQIAAKYDVSVEWLKGETDEKKPATPEGSGLSKKELELLRLFDLASPEIRAAALAVLESALPDHKVQGEDSTKQ